MTTWVRALSSVPIMGSARTPSHSFTTGVDSSSMSCCWRRITCSRFFWYTSVVYRPRLVEQLVGPPNLLEHRAGVLAELLADVIEQRGLEREDEGGRLGGTESLDPAAPRDPAQHSRTGAHSTPRRTSASRRSGRPAGAGPETPSTGPAAPGPRSGRGDARRTPAGAASTGSAHPPHGCAGCRGSGWDARGSRAWLLGRCRMDWDDWGAPGRGVAGDGTRSPDKLSARVGT